MPVTYDYPCAFSHWGEEEREAIQRVIASERYTMGEEVEAFEHEFSAWHGMKHGIMVNSGSSANLVAVAALFHKEDRPLRAGDTAIVPAVAWATTYAPLIQHRMRLHLIDCDFTWCAQTPLNLPFDIERLVVGCSILGNPAHLPMWQNYAEHGAKAYFIEDNCESLGARVDAYAGQLCGTFGLLNTFSFYHSHQLSAIEGGMILTDDDEMNDLCRMLRDHGMTRWRKPKTFDEEYDFRLMGYNLRPVEMHAAIARAQLPKIEDFRKRRQQNLNNFLLLADDLPLSPQHQTGMPSPFGLQFVVKDKETRSRLVAALRGNGIDCRLPTGGSFTRHFYGRKLSRQKTPNADMVHDTALFLGNAPFDITDKIERAVAVMRGVL